MNGRKKVDVAVDNLGELVKNKQEKHLQTFDEFLVLASEKPEIVFRNIQQRMHDMVKFFVGEGENEYPQDEESVGYLAYNCDPLFVEGNDKHFFTDRLFANNFMRVVSSFRKGNQQNKIYAFVGPPGCGKSTFANILLKKFQDYSQTEDGRGFEIVWKLKREVEGHGNDVKTEIIEVPCPCHDHPISLIPIDHRIEFLDGLLGNKEFKFVLSDTKEYEWVFRTKPCTICSSLFNALLERNNGSLQKVLEMVYVKPIKYDRSISRGIAVYHPGEVAPRVAPVFGNKKLQEKLDAYFEDSNKVKYKFSNFAKTNNGIHVLMDVKGSNVDRFIELHNVISEGISKAEEVEETVDTLFISLMNPEDRDDVRIKKMGSFQDRIQYCEMTYVTEVAVEMEIYRDIFGRQIDNHFLPRVLENFARIVISTRMMNANKKKFGDSSDKTAKSEALLDWIDADKLKRYSGINHCDPEGIILRQEISRGVIPLWISEDDKKRLVASKRRKLLKELSECATSGITGRDSIRLFDKIYSVALKRGKPVAMKDIISFFGREMSSKEIIKGGKESMPKLFLKNLDSWYDNTVVQEMKEALFHYNEKQISQDILNYIFAVAHDLGSVVRCPYTKDEFKITKDFFDSIELRLLGSARKKDDVWAFRPQVVRKHSELLARGESITETDLYEDLFKKYTHNLKKSVLDPFMGNDNFRKAIMAYGDENVFKTFDERIRRDVKFLISNLTKGAYKTEESAKNICLYVLEHEIVLEYA